ncbi:MAG: hypothetical protein OXE85_00680 [Roseovarius sp.]|nr:hypothetical protein [Roseovarius sp.]
MRAHDDGWRKAIPKVNIAGRETCGKLELPDVAAVEAGLAVQSWQKVREQTARANAYGCMVYRMESDTITADLTGLQAGTLYVSMKCNTLVHRCHVGAED